VPTWSSAAKTGVGASYEAYVDGQYKDGGPTGAVSRVWFSIANGVLTETMYGLIHEAQIKQMRFAVVTDAGLSVEGTDTTERTEYLDTDAHGRPLSPAYRVDHHRQGRLLRDREAHLSPTPISSRWSCGPPSGR
jgi:glucoamylase